MIKRRINRMKKIFKLAAAVLLAVSALSLTSFAGEFITQSDGRVYYDTGEAFDFDGWHWIMRTDGLARCYYFSNGYVWPYTYTPDGYMVNSEGEWVDNGQVVTRSTYESKETDWYAFEGLYHVRQLNYASGAIDRYNATEWPIRIVGAQEGATLVWNDGSTQWFVPEGHSYSFACSDGTLLDVVDENNFRILWPDGAIYYVSR